MGHFKVSKVTNLVDVKEGDELQESDFACIVEDKKFVQMQYFDEEKLETYETKPGIWKMIKTNAGMRLVKSEFSKDEILENFVNTKELENKIDCFFRNLHEYKALRKEIPKRAALIWGPAGTGKTASVVHCANKYVSQFNDVAVIIWNTDALDPFDVKNFIQTFEYVGVTKLIVIAEDLGGAEMENVQMKSLSSLLSLLDNKEKTFSIPVFIVATTNFPANFLGNIANRPERFDDKIEMPNPNGEQRKDLLQFFLRNFADKYTKEQIDDVCNLVAKEAYSGFSIAHLQEVVVKSRIYEKTLLHSLDIVKRDIELFLKAFEKQKGGFGIGKNFDEND